MQVILKLFYLLYLMNICCQLSALPDSQDFEVTEWDVLKTHIESHQQKGSDSVFYFLKKADSWVNLGELSPNDQLFLLNCWGDYYAETQVADSALWFLERAMHKSKDSSYQDVYYGQVLKLADAYNNYNVSDSALLYYREALVYYQEIKDSLSMASALSGIASALITDGNFTEALENLHKAEEILKTTTQYRDLGVIYDNISLINARLGYEKNTIEYGKRAIAQYEKARDTLLLANAYANLGVSYKNLDKPDTAMYFYDMSNELARMINSKWLLAKNLHNIAVLYEETGKPDKALENYNASLEICIEENFPFGEFNNSVNLGDFALGQKNYQEAVRYLKRARSIGSTFNFDMLGIVYYKLHLAHAGKGEYKQAITNLRTYTHFQDSLVKAQKHKEIMELQTRYETQKKEAQILKLQKEKQGEALLRAYLLLSVVGIVMVALLLLLRSRRKQAEARQSNLKLEKENQQKQSRMEKLQLEKQLQEQSAEKYRLDLKLKEQELVYHTLKQAGLNHLVKKIKDKLNPFTWQLARKKDQEEFSRALQEIAYDASQEPLADFEEMFLQMHDGFYEKLLEINPDFTRSELQMAALLRMNLPSKEIAGLIHLELSTIDKRRHHIRQKLGLSSDQSLSAFLISL